MTTTRNHNTTVSETGSESECSASPDHELVQDSTRNQPNSENLSNVIMSSFEEKNKESISKDTMNSADKENPSNKLGTQQELFPISLNMSSDQSRTAPHPLEAKAFDARILTDIHAKLDGFSDMKNDLLDLKNSIQELIQGFKFNELLLNEANATIGVIKEDNAALKTQVQTLQNQTNFLHNKLIYQEDFSRRENLVISGISEENRENCFMIAQDIFSHLGADNVVIQRCHRVGQKRHGTHRDILVRLLYFSDKIMLLRRKGNLPRGIFFNEDYSGETRRRINAIRPAFKEAKKHDARAVMVKDKIIFRGKEYSLENIGNIGFDNTKISEKKNNSTIAFAGRFSSFSNLSPAPIEIDGVLYASTEHFYQYNKCLASGNHTAAAEVLLSKEPESAMTAGAAVKATKEWTQTEGKRIMKRAAKIKFTPQHMQQKLRSTGDRHIAEATRNTLWGVGVPFTSDCLNMDTYKGENIMGQILMELRAELPPDAVPDDPLTNEMEATSF